MKRRSVSATIPRFLDSFVSAGGLTHLVQVPKSTAVAPLDAAAMEILCSDQIGMCTVSCQSKSKQAARKRALEQSLAGAGPDKNKVPAPAAYSLDPSVPRDPICSAQCARQFSCGTRSAPEYHNLNDFLASSDTPDGHPNSKDGASAADAKQRNSRNNGPDSGKLFELRLSKLTSVAIAIASIIAAQHVTR
ncbi:hypothetical protein BGX24_006776 [Mortierella sp. AD032]|nr:hypothetical protein BGX24_006776 [Mortierella sp. AD032]